MNHTIMNNGMADSNNLLEGSRFKTYNRSRISLWFITLRLSHIRRILGQYNAVNKLLLALSDLRHRAMHKDRDPTALRDGGRIGRHGKHWNLARLRLVKAVFDPFNLHV